jgi:FKBP-type peptidyl-prolyl cis-trans isomerase
MDAQRLIKDLGIIAILALIATLIYLAIPGEAAPEQRPAETNNQSQPMTTSQPNKTAQLHVEVLKEGSGAVTQNGNKISVEYTGKLADGTVFDSSKSHGQPFSLTLGKGEVIPGWELGLSGMKVGEKRQLTIPPELAYGPNGFPGVIPPNATLTFEVELLAIE